MLTDEQVNEELAEYERWNLEAKYKEDQRRKQYVADLPIDIASHITPITPAETNTTLITPVETKPTPVTTLPPAASTLHPASAVQQPISTAKCELPTVSKSEYRSERDARDDRRARSGSVKEESYHSSTHRSDERRPSSSQYPRPSPSVYTRSARMPSRSQYVQYAHLMMTTPPSTVAPCKTETRSLKLNESARTIQVL